jgi:N-acetylmuramoyl-L-alanine amidase
MLRKLFYTLLCSLSIGIVCAQELNSINFLLKDTTIIGEIKQGIYNHPAIEIASKTEKTTFPGNRSFPIRIAIDPGHVATSKKEALIEERYIRSKDGFFYESELSMATALVLKKKFEALGFRVMLTRTPETSAVGMSYSEWFKKRAKKDLKEDLYKGLITQDKYDELIHSNKKDLFHKYFKDKDFLARKEMINNFKPDITLVIHYNSSEFTNHEKDLAPEVQHNYSVAFVPGGFTKYELGIENQLEDFIRLATTDIIERSISLSSFIVNEFETKLNAPRLLPNNDPELWYLKKYSVYTGQPGVFSRNLFLTRTIASPICYGEATLQNNKDEMKLLVKRDADIKPYKISSRVYDVADCYYNGTLKYFHSIGWVK